RLLICSTFGDGVYRSLDDGQSWARANSGLSSLRIMTVEMAVGPGGVTIVWITTIEGALYSSTDLGQTWLQVATPFGVLAVAASADYATDSIVILGADDGRSAESLDGGIASASSWTLLGTIAPGERVNKLVVPAGFKNSGTLFAGTTGGLYRSTDSGASYQIIDAVPAEHVQAIIASPDYGNDSTVFAASANLGVFKSTDSGNNWTQFPTGIPPSNQSAVQHFTFAISSHYATDQTVLLGTFSGLAISSDGGESWIESDTRPPSLTMGIAISPEVASDSTLFAPAYTSGGYFSNSLGDNWTSANMGLGNFTIYDAQFIKPSGSANPVLYAVQQSLVLRSFDVGRSWEFLSSDPLPGRRVFPSKLVLSPDFEQDSTMFMGSRADGILRSTDGGLNWQQVHATPGASISALAVSPKFATDQSVFMATTLADIQRSTDGGSTWNSIRPNLPVTESPYYLALSPAFATDRLVLLGTPQGLYRSADAGDSWHAVVGPQVGSGVIQAIAVSPSFASDATALVTVRGQGLFRSMDGGNNWQQIAPLLVSNTIQFGEIRFSPNYAIDQTLFGISHNRILRSSDRGDSWQDASLDVVRHEDARQSVQFSGTWYSIPISVFSAATVNVAIDSGSEAKINFFGTGVDWIGLLGPSSGYAEVYLDGALVETVDQFRPATTINASVFSIQDLPPGSHELRIVATGAQDPFAFGNTTLVDAIEVTRASDLDADSIPDLADNCPLIMNTAQTDGDSDGHGDACDNCRGQANTQQIDFDNDGYGNACDADYDNDGFVGESDALRIQAARFTFDPLVDLTEDSYVDIPDLIRFMELYLQPVAP
ncbi:MAG: thrombospondin type 3 repeat-containing protein, partial [Gammaproteobacteria bacterium]|nr:thrombospondin type 3 repeat-containing protein [Gammaproteobacteria bacterium]